MSAIINEDLQATHQLLSLLEKSKANTERVLDELPDVLCVVDREGVIRKANLMAAETLGTKLEHALGKRLASLYRTETWDIFKSKLAALGRADGDSVEFELTADAYADAEKIHYWTLRPLGGAVNTDGSLVCAVARDVTKMRAFERQLVEIFSSIPLGIVTLDSHGRIEGPYSAFTEWLLGRNDLAGHELHELLFAPAWNQLSPEERQGALMLQSFQGGLTAEAYEMIAATFPRQIPLGSRWIGLRYQPIVYGDQVKRLMVILEDRTRLVEAEETERRSRLLEDLHVKRILALKALEPEVRSSLLGEMDLLFRQARANLRSGDLKAFKNMLHGIKGSSRIARFDSLRDQTHALEDGVAEGCPLPVLGEGFSSIEKEWLELRALARALEVDGPGPDSQAGAEGDAQRSKSAVKALENLWRQYHAAVSCGDDEDAVALSERILLAIQSLGARSLAELEPVVTRKATETAAQLGKRVDVAYDWEGVRAPYGMLATVSAILTHVVTNAVDHGIESEGRVTISCRQEAGRYLFEVADNGRGIDLEKVRRAAVRAGLISIAKAFGLDPQEARQLVFSSGLSTAEAVTQVSGRGLGLDAVRAMVEKAGGRIEAFEGQGGVGTVFRFQIEDAREPVQMTCQRWEDFAEALTRTIAPYAEVERLQTAGGRELIFCDPMGIRVAVATYVSDLARQGRVKVRFERRGGNVTCIARRVGRFPGVGGPGETAPDELALAMPSCETFLRRHGGACIRSQDGVILTFGSLVDAPDMVIRVARGRGVQAQAAEDTFRRLVKVASQVGVTVVSVGDSAGEGYDAVILPQGTPAGEQAAFSLGGGEKTLRAELLAMITVSLARPKGAPGEVTPISGRRAA